MSDTPPDVGLQAGPCTPWATVDDFRGDPACSPWDDDAKYPDEVVEAMLVAASEAMFQLGGRRWPGVCADTVQPASCAVVPRRPHLGFGCCSGGRMIALGSYPVVEVTEVLVDGVAVDEGDYEVIDWQFLHRKAGDGWPCCNRRPAEGEPWPLTVSFTFGQAPPALGRLGTVALARELAKSTCGEECGLDARATSVSREGTTITFPSLAEVLTATEGSGTGIAEVDMFVHAHNPNGLRRRARILTPGAGKPFRVTS